MPNRWNRTTISLLIFIFISLWGITPSHGVETKAPVALNYVTYKTFPFDQMEARQRQCETAMALGLPMERTIEIRQGVEIQFLLIPAGEFLMGASPPDKPSRWKLCMAIGVFCFGSLGAIGIFAFIAKEAVVNKRRPQFSLQQLILFYLFLNAAALGAFWLSHCYQRHLLYKEEFLSWKPRGEGREKPHNVCIEKPFYLSKTEVTMEQWLAVMANNDKANGVDRTKDKNWADWVVNYEEIRRKPPLSEIRSQLPSEGMSWELANLFCSDLSRAKGMRIRLPSEAEWEYACRAGTAERFYFGPNEKLAGEYAWWGVDAAQPVGQKKANFFGLYDMLGNISEYCGDIYLENTYDLCIANSSVRQRIEKNTLFSSDQLVSDGEDRVVRGGSYCVGYFDCAARDYVCSKNVDGIGYGFRLVLELDVVVASKNSSNP